MPDVMSGRGLSNDQTFISFMEEIDPSGWYPEMPMSHSDPQRSYATPRHQRLVTE